MPPSTPRWRRVALWSLFWAALGTFFASQAMLMTFSERTPMPWYEALLANVPSYLLWGAIAPLVLAGIRRWPVERIGAARFLALQAPLALLVAAVHLAGMELVFFLVRRAFGMHPDPLASLAFSFRYNYHMNVVTYAGIVATKIALDTYRRAREKELVATRLQEQVVRAELAALKMQLQPHFLFNTLNSISALVHSDPDAADRMLVLLSDLLRLTLDGSGRQEVPLARELEFAERYLEIERVRYQDRLCVDLDIEPETLAAEVPNFVLQPLVENAIKHGISRRAAAGRIALRARRAGGRLHIAVEDDGPGPARSPASGFGVGLANTRARLAQLYGEAAFLELVERPEGGTVARLALPFTPSPAPSTS